MGTFKIEIQEFLSRTIELQADNKDDAIKIVKENYENENIVLDYSDYIDTDIKELLD